MNTIYNPNPNEWTTILKRPTSTFEDVEETVKGIFKEVQQKGDQALFKYTSLFDGVTLESLEVTFQTN